QKLKEVFADARAYQKAKTAEGKAGIPRHDDDPRLEAMLPAIDGKIPVIVVAQQLRQIRAALAWAKEEKITLVLAGIRDGWRAAGKDATLIVTDGDILDLRTHVVAAYLDGRALDLSDKQKRLYERYKARPRPATR